MGGARILQGLGQGLGGPGAGQDLGALGLKGGALPRQPRRVGANMGKDHRAGPGGLLDQGAAGVAGGARDKDAEGRGHGPPLSGRSAVGGACDPSLCPLAARCRRPGRPWSTPWPTTSSISASPCEHASKRSGGIFDVAAKQRRIQELNEFSNDPAFWSDQERSQAYLKERANLERAVKLFQRLEVGFSDADTLLELGDEAGDEDTLAEAEAAFLALAPVVREAEVQQMLSEEADDADAILDINSGAGGTDAADFAEMLKRMYLQWAARMGFKAKVVDEHPHEEAGIKSCRIEVTGPYAYGYLKSEIGVHRLVRISPFDSNARRHTAFASVDAAPDLPDDIEVDLKEVDCRIDTYRSSGAGGQHVNTTDSAVRITHNPTGLVVTCQDERSQHKNKAKAWKLMRAKLFQYEMEKRQEEIDAVNADKKRIEWGSQIRNYVLQPYRLVKDLRTGVEQANTDRVLDGDLLPFMEAWLVRRRGSEADDKA